jgi:hypothetical protein
MTKPKSVREVLLNDAEKTVDEVIADLRTLVEGCVKTKKKYPHVHNPIHMAFCCDECNRIDIENEIIAETKANLDKLWGGEMKGSYSSTEFIEMFVEWKLFEFSILCYITPPGLMEVIFEKKRELDNMFSALEWLINLPTPPKKASQNEPKNRRGGGSVGKP